MDGSNKTTHFVGIGGAGMSGIARILLEKQCSVSGSDLKHSAVMDNLAKKGARLFVGHSEANLSPDVGLVVVSSAIPDSNVEIQEARRRNLEIVPRGEMLARLMEGYRGISVAGAHGKTTITSMIAICLEKNGMDPTVVVGGELGDIGGNAKLGTGEYMVAEADESDGSFLRLKPFVAVASNVEDDHLDYYGTVDNIGRAFQKYLHNTIPGGMAVICADDPFLREIASSDSFKRVATYGAHPSADFRGQLLAAEGFATRSEIFWRDRKLGILELNVPGRHNMINALAAIAVGIEVGIGFEDAGSALRDFQGAGRRFQILGQDHGITVIDDYAHHPTEIKATLSAARQGKPKRIVAVFQPHRFSRTKYLHEEFAKAFEYADMVIINEIYSAGEKPIPGVTSELIIRDMEKNGNGPVFNLPTLQETVEFLLANLHEGDLLITLGAGDVWKVGLKWLEDSASSPGKS